MTGIVVLAVTLTLATAFGLWRQRTAGRVRTSTPDREPNRGPGLDWLADPAARATLLQFSASSCAPCRTTRTVLSQIATELQDVAHVELDAAEHLDLTRALGVYRTPTVLFLDPSGRETHRAVGAVKRAEVLAVLNQ